MIDPKKNGCARELFLFARGVLLCLFVIVATCSGMVGCFRYFSQTVILRADSPDGRWQAVVREFHGSALDGYSYSVEVKENGFFKPSTDVFWCGEAEQKTGKRGLLPVWRSNKWLEIRYSEADRPEISPMAGLKVTSLKIKL